MESLYRPYIKASPGLRTLGAGPSLLTRTLGAIACSKLQYIQPISLF